MDKPPETTELSEDLSHMLSLSIAENAALKVETERLRTALADCASMFVLKHRAQQEIDYEAIARELYRRMKVAKEALKHG